MGALAREVSLSNSVPQHNECSITANKEAPLRLSGSWRLPEPRTQEALPGFGTLNEAKNF